MKKEFIIENKYGTKYDLTDVVEELKIKHPILVDVTIEPSTHNGIPIEGADSLVNIFYKQPGYKKIFQDRIVLEAILLTNWIHLKNIMTKEEMVLSNFYSYCDSKLFSKKKKLDEIYEIQ